MFTCTESQDIFKACALGHFNSCSDLNCKTTKSSRKNFQKLGEIFRKKSLSTNIHFSFARNSICSNRFPTPFMLFFTLEKFRFLVSPLCVFSFFSYYVFFARLITEISLRRSLFFLFLNIISVYLALESPSMRIAIRLMFVRFPPRSPSLFSISVPLNIIFASQYSHNRGQEISAFTIVSCHNTCRCRNSQCWSWQH